MKCSTCGKDNTYKSEFCAYCGHQFTKDEHENAYLNTGWGKFEKFESYITLSKFLSSRPVRIAIIVIIIAFGVWNIVRNGAGLRVEKSNDYTVEYNAGLKTSYLKTELPAVSVGLYLPHATDSVVIQRLENNGKVKEKKVFAPEEDIVLEASNEDYYSIEVNYTKSGAESQFIYLYQVSGNSGNVLGGAE